jgi:hypothetical protein
MSALPAKADIAESDWHVRSGTRLQHVRRQRDQTSVFGLGYVSPSTGSFATLAAIRAMLVVNVMHGVVE